MSATQSNLIEIAHRPEHTRIEGRRLGRSKVVRDPRTLRLTHYIQGMKEEPPPTHVSYEAKVPAWGMMLNDSLGDCVCATAGHMIEQWTAYGHQPEVTPTDDQILAAYEKIGGYVPGDPSTDNGCDMLNALQTWRKDGIAGHQIAAYVSLSGLFELKMAIWLFGNAYLGIALPVMSQSQSRWFVDLNTSLADRQPGSWGGHCIPAVGYGDMFNVVTWGGVLNMTQNYWNLYGDEAYAVLTHDWIEQNGRSGSGFDFARLTEDLNTISTAARPAVKR